MAAARLLQTIHPEPAVTAGGRTVAATKIGGNAVLITVRGGRTAARPQLAVGGQLDRQDPLQQCCVVVVRQTEDKAGQGER